jgi:hypothetical protein
MLMAQDSRVTKNEKRKQRDDWLPEKKESKGVSVHSSTSRLVGSSLEKASYLLLTCTNQK